MKSELRIRPEWGVMNSTRWPNRADGLPDEATVVMCDLGERTMGTAVLLEGAWHHGVVVRDGFPADRVKPRGREPAPGA